MLLAAGGGGFAIALLVTILYGGRRARINRAEAARREEGLRALADLLGKARAAKVRTTEVAPLRDA